MVAPSSPKIRVLVVDDAVVIRKIVTDALNKDPNIEVVGVAANGKIALQKIPQCNPDIITLDVEMPEMNGIETVGAIRENYTKLPIVMFSTLTERGASATLDALSAGANDYCTKPANVGSVGEARTRVEAELITKIKSLCGHAKPLPPRQSDLKPAPPLQTSMPRQSKVAKPSVFRSSSSIQDIQILCIGVSTGGPNALADLIPRLPGDLPVPIVCVQHMPPLFTGMLAQRLNEQSNIEVVEAQEGMALKPACMYIAPGDYHLTIKRSGTEYVTVLDQNPPENSCRPAADPLFRSVVEHFGGHTLALVLTGMGQDGFRGCEYVRQAGGQIVVQDEETSVVWGMPGFVAEAGLHDAIVPLEQIAPELVRRIQQKKSLSTGR